MLWYCAEAAQPFLVDGRSSSCGLVYQFEHLLCEIFCLMLWYGKDKQRKKSPGNIKIMFNNSLRLHSLYFQEHYELYRIFKLGYWPLQWVYILIFQCWMETCASSSVLHFLTAVIATTTHTTLVTGTPQYPQQPTATPGQPHPYQGAQYPPYQPVPVQPGYGAQPSTSPYPAPMFSAGPPPTYQEASECGSFLQVLSNAPV